MPSQPATAASRRLGPTGGAYSPEARRLRPEAWPAADRAAWKRAVAPAAGPLDPRGRAAHLRPLTQKVRAGAWGQYLNFLALRSLLDPAEALPGGRSRPVGPTDAAGLEHCVFTRMLLACQNMFQPERIQAGEVWNVPFTP